MKTPFTPFPTSGYFGSEYFCDRQQELAQLKQHVHGGSSINLIALRRMGKTALIRHLQKELEHDFLGVYVDILPTESMLDMLNSLASAIARMVPERSRPGAKVWKFLKSLRPVVSYDSLSGMPTLTFSHSPEESLRSMEEIFTFLERQSKPVILAIDEFQQILNYKEKHMDAWLRSRIQALQNVVFIFSGSQQHLMNKLFADPSRPFYRSTQFLKLGKIDRDIYHQFIRNKFEDFSKQIQDQTIESVLDWTDGYTYYVQLLCNRLFISSGKQVHLELWKEEAMKLLNEQEYVFYSYREGLTHPQWSLLKAIARENVVKAPTSNEFITGHQLGTSATVLRSLKTLEKKELVFRELDQDGKAYYGVYDILFRRWIRG